MSHAELVNLFGTAVQARLAPSRVESAIWRSWHAFQFWRRPSRYPRRVSTSPGVERDDSPELAMADRRVQEWLS